MSIAAPRAPKAVHPGQILRDYLEDYGVSQSETARLLNTTIGKINEVCRGKRGISPEMAVKLGKLFSTSPNLWMNLQQAWELQQVAPSVAKRVKALKAKKIVGSQAA